MLEPVFAPVLSPPIKPRVDVPASVARTSNLLAPLTWHAGTNTTLSLVDGVQQGAAIGTANPRVVKGPLSLEAGTYRYSGDVKIGTTPGGARFRVSTDSDLASGHIVDATFGVDTSYDDTFTLLDAAAVHVGVVGVGNANGQWIGIADGFVLIAED